MHLSKKAVCCIINSGRTSGAPGSILILLRKQLADPLEKFCKDAFTAEFVAEAVLTWTMAGKSFDELYRVLKPLFEKEK